jgi:DNA-binding transcriptional MocR family regulator
VIDCRNEFLNLPKKYFMSISSSSPLDTTRFIARHVAGLRRSGIRDFFELVAKTDGVISLGIGEPDFDTPQPIRDAVTTAMNTGKTHYTSNMGLPALRAEISRYAEGHFKVSYRPDDEILVTVGVSEGLDLTLRSLLNPGDKVMYHQPCYVSYAPSVDLVHAVGVPVVFAGCPGPRRRLAAGVQTAAAESAVQSDRGRMLPRAAGAHCQICHREGPNRGQR